MNNYPEQFDHLQRLVAKLMMEEPGTLGGFRHLHKESQAEGALPTKTKELMALAISIAVTDFLCFNDSTIFEL
jgi:alkylhydroperoxidase/carboxymuconolactone decarboxylase family protein YurZ